MKTCSHCKIEKESSEFHKRGDRLKSHCKECRKKLENEKSRIRMRKYKQENPDTVKKQQREYYAKKDKKERNSKQREYFERNPEAKIRHNLRCRINKAVTKKSNNTMGLVGCDSDQLMRHIESMFDEHMSWENYGDWHVDHILPCAHFDLTDPEQQAKCFHYTNLQPLWASDNLSKSNKLL